jgi:hypothetical protein
MVEREYAARGPEGLVCPWGDVLDGHLLNSRDASYPVALGTESFNDGYVLQVPK